MTARRNDEAMRWAIAGGGTGGHVTMALALAEELTAAGDPVLFVGSERGLEARLVRPAGFELVTLPARPYAGRGPIAKVAALFAFASATISAFGLLRRRRIAIVLSVGGYAAAPAAAAAILLRRPLGIVEPNAIPGRTHRALARFATHVFTAFSAAEPAFAGRAPVETTGAPLRRGLLTAFADAGSRRVPAAPFHLLVVGGSQGARQLNDAMLEALPDLDPERVEIVHQTGTADRARVLAAYRRAGFRADVVDFDPALPARYRWADLVLCRSGALTVAELAMAGLPSLLVPYPHAADDHQRANARALEESGAGRLLDPAHFDGKQLASALAALFERPDTLLEMSRHARELARPDAARRIVEVCRSLLSESRTEKAR